MQTPISIKGDFYLLFLFITLIFSSATSALTEQEFIQKVLSQDRFFEKDQLYVNIKQIELDASRDSYADWNSDLTIELNNSYYDIDKDTTSKSIYERQRHNNKQSIKLATKKRFLSNPSSLNISFSRQTPDSDIERYKQDKLYTTKTYNGSHSISTFDNAYKISYKYPLLKHDGNAASLKTYRRNILDLAREKLDFKDAQESFLVKRLRQYLSWVWYEKRADVYQNYLQALHDVELTQAADKGVLEIAISRANTDILANDSRLQAQKKSLMVGLDDADLSLQNPEIDENKQPNIITTGLGQYLVKNIRRLLKQDMDIELKTLDAKHYKNQVLPKLDFTISAEKNDNKGNTLTTRYKNSSVNYVSSLVFNIPIGEDVNSEKDIRIAKLNLRKLNIDYDNILQDIKSDVQALAAGLSIKQKTLRIFKETLADINENTDLVLTNYANQSINIENLLDSYTQKRDVELEYAAAMLGYHRDILQYNDKLDRVLPDGHIFYSSGSNYQPNQQFTKQ